jgi:hypothetical protein
LSQQSENSSSIYPPSTPTASNYARTFTPASPKGKERDDGIPSIRPDETDYQEFDADDVSLRLRLLVNNNYFLPPAHSKPTAADLAGSSLNAKRSTKAPSPSLLDIFRIGKSRSKPTTPVTTSPPTDLLVPKLRTTSDATTSTASPHLQQSPQRPIVHVSPMMQQGRVVVVREKVEDLMTAAKQVDQETKFRNDQRSHPAGNSKKPNEEKFDGIIDPTDAVDLPQPSSKYPFTLQASAVQGLGVQDSVGAALLADRLPPPRSPGSWSLSTEEENWRKDILQQAVGHSFNNTPVSSFRGKSSGRSTVTAPSTTSSDRERTVSSAPSPPPGPSVGLGQPIIPHALLNRHVQHSPSMPKLDIGRTDPSVNPRLLRKFSAPEFQHGSLDSFTYPIRAETPTIPTTPLAPPPRRQIVNLVYSLSQSDLGDPHDRRMTPSPSPSLHSAKSSFSSSRLSDVYEAEVNTGRSIVSPPPVFVRGPEGTSPLPCNRTLASETSGSRYFDDDEVDGTWYHTPADTDDAFRLSASLPTSSRHSFADRQYPSPTASAFQDALNDHHHPSSLYPEQSAQSSGRSSFVSATSASRFSMVSPPPRASSSFAGHVLPPPPRTSRRPRSSPDRSSNIPTEPITILGPEPATPPLPISERRGTRVLSLHIPGLVDPPEVRSAPPTNSSISFFDSIQSDLNAMDDYSEDGSSDEDDRHHHPRQAAPAVVNPQMKPIITRPSTGSLKPSLMRWANHSTPQLGYSSEAYPAFDPHTMKYPVVNTPEKATFFASRKGVKGAKGNQGISALDFVPPPRTSSLSMEQKKPSLEGRKSLGSQKTGRGSQDESTRRLDGMVMRHLEAERDTIKRIAASSRLKA